MKNKTLLACILAMFVVLAMPWLVGVNSVVRNTGCGSSNTNSGGLVCLEQHTASNSAELDFTTCITSAYDDYQIELVNVIPASDSVSIVMQMSTNGGSSYDTGSNYDWGILRYTAAASAQAGVAATTSITLIDFISNASTGGASGFTKLYSPLSSVLHKFVTGEFSGWQSSAGNRFVASAASGRYAITTAVNAFRILAASGNLTSGTVRCSAMAK